MRAGTTQVKAERLKIGRRFNPGRRQVMQASVSWARGKAASSLKSADPALSVLNDLVAGAQVTHRQRERRRWTNVVIISRARAFVADCDRSPSAENPGYLRRSRKVKSSDLKILPGQFGLIQV